MDDKAFAGVHCGATGGGSFDVESDEGVWGEGETGEGRESYGPPVIGIGGGAGGENDHYE